MVAFKNLTDARKWAKSNLALTAWRCGVLVSLPLGVGRFEYHATAGLVFAGFVDGESDLERARR